MKRAPWLVLALVVIGGVALWLMPEEKTLGGAVRLVFLHGAFIWACLALYFLAGLAGVWYWLRTDERAFISATSLWRWAVVANAISFPTGLYAAKVIWGSILWSEPRVFVNALMLLTSVLILGVSLISANRKGLSALYTIAAMSYAVILQRTSRVLHPVNPVGTSDSLSIKLSFAVITLVALGLAVEAVRREVRGQIQSSRG